MFNGHIWRDDIIGLTPHFVEPGREVPTKSSLKEKGGKATVMLLFRGVPSQPNEKKWEKVGPVLDWHLLTTGVMNFLPQIVSEAYGQITIRTILRGDAGKDIADPEVHDVTYHELEGRRHASFATTCKLPSTLYSEIVLAIVLEPLRILMRWFRKRGSEMRRMDAMMRGKTPPLCDLTWLPASPVVRVRQYLSQLLNASHDDEPAPRLVLLWGRTHSNYAEWANDNPDVNDQLRRTVSCADTLVDKAHHRSSMSLPWVVTGVVDTRRSEDDQAMVAQGVRDSDPETRDPWFTEKFLEHFGDSLVLRAPAVRRSIWQWAWSMLLTCAPNEWKHGRNRHRADKSQSWSNFVAHSSNQELALCHGWRKRAQDGNVRKSSSRRPAPSSTSQEEGTGASGKTGQKRKINAYDAFRFTEIDARTSAGESVRITSAKFVNELGAEWAAVQRDPERLRTYEAQAVVGRPAANAPIGAAVVPYVRAPRVVGDVGALLGPPVLKSGAFHAVDGRLLCMSPAEQRDATWPCSADLLRHHFSSKHEDGVRVGPTKAVLVGEYAELHNHYAATRRAEPNIRTPPAPRWLPTPDGAVGRRKRLESELQRFVNAAANPTKMSDIPYAYLVVRCEASWGEAGDDSAEFWFHIASGNGQAGPVPWRANAIRLGRIGAAAGETMLQMQRQPFVRTRRALKIGGPVAVGMFVTASHWDIAAMLLEGGRARAPRVVFTFSKQLNQRVGSDMFRILGCDPHLPATVVELDSGLDSSKGGGKGSKRDGPRDDPGHVDWGRDLLPAPIRDDALTGGQTRRKRAVEYSPETSPLLEGHLLHAICDAADPALALEVLPGERSDEEGSDSDAAELAPSAGPSSSAPPPAAPAPPPVAGPSSSPPSPPVTPSNVLEVLRDVDCLADVEARAGYFFNNAWELRRRAAPSDAPLTKVRCIQGASLRADCKIHAKGDRGVCKIHLDTFGEFEACQAAILRWGVHGVDRSYDEHIAAAMSEATHWRNRDRG